MLLTLTILTAAPSLAAEGVYEESEDGSLLLSFLIESGSIETAVAGAAIHTTGGRTLEVKCALPNGEDSERLICQSGDREPIEDAWVGTVELLVDGSPVDFEAFDIALSRVERMLDRRGATIASVEELDIKTFPAEAVWVGWKGNWVCQLEESDFTACVSVCGGVAMVKDLSTSAAGPNDSYFNEPSCDVTCRCFDGTTTVTNDPPEVISLDDLL